MVLIVSYSEGSTFSLNHPASLLIYSVSSQAKAPTSTVHRTTLQSVTITSRKLNLKEDERRSLAEPSPSDSSSLPSPPSQNPPSLLATLLARKRSIVIVPATKEVSPPLRGTSRPSPERLPYLPHSPFHLFSYDLEEEAPPAAHPNRSEESSRPPSPRSGGERRSCLQQDYLLTCTFPLLLFPALAFGTSWDFFSAPLSLVRHLLFSQFFSRFSTWQLHVLSFCHLSRLHVSVFSSSAELTVARVCHHPTLIYQTSLFKGSAALIPS